MPESSTWIATVIAAIVSGGAVVTASVVAAKRGRFFEMSAAASAGAAEAQKNLFVAWSDYSKLLQGRIDALEKDNDDKDKRIVSLEQQLSGVGDLKARLDQCQRDSEELKLEIARLRVRFGFDRDKSCN